MTLGTEFCKLPVSDFDKTLRSLTPRTVSGDGAGSRPRKVVLTLRGHLSAGLRPRILQCSKDVQVDINVRRQS